MRTEKEIKDMIDSLEDKDEKYILVQDYLEWALETKQHEWNTLTLESYLKEAVCIDGAHHKQWFLEKIAKTLNIELPEHEEGITP